MGQPLYTSSDTGRISRIGENRDPFRRDHGRLIHSAVFRRLQGKTQLFPSYESDFFRNRLTHSLEVAQISKGIAEQINEDSPYFQENPINLTLVETAALAHDLGHPPFGHNGERALDYCMKEYGGFEGNAQTLRIITKLEKKDTFGGGFVPIGKDGTDNRCGLNLTFRTIAATLKYDKAIYEKRAKGDPVSKGYYYTERDIVDAARKNVLGADCNEELKTIECQIMDIADDIAYSTYDLEDAFKADFLSPMKMLASEDELLERTAKKVRNRLGLHRYGKDAVKTLLLEQFEQIAYIEDAVLFAGRGKIKRLDQLIALLAPHSFDLSDQMCRNGYYRTEHTSKMVHEFMSAVKVDVIRKKPVLSEVKLDFDIRKKVEVLKNYSYEALIMSPRMKVTEFRGYDIVREIFDVLKTKDNKFKGYELMPDDFQLLYEGFKDEALKMRVICDFIAGMTDRYAVEFYARLKSENPQTIFKPF